MRDPITRVAVAVLLLVVGAAASAMFFADDASEFLDQKSWTASGSKQPMELRGRWLGMGLGSLQSETAREMNLPPSVRGVMVGELDNRRAWRARQAGVTSGDVIVGIEGKQVRDLADLFDATQKVNANSPILLDVLRWGQPLTLVLPAVASAPAASVPPAVAQAVLPPVASNPAAAAPNLVLNAPAPALVGGVQAAGVAPAGGRALFGCPLHGLAWPQASVHPHYRCPHCNSPLRQVP